MAKSQKAAIQKELLERATGKGKEPNWEGEPSKLQLVKALNYYSSLSITTDQLKKYAISWATKFRPEKLEIISVQPAEKFQTYGSLMRMISNGLTLGTKEVQTLDKFVDSLQMPIIVEQPTTPKNKRKKQMLSAENANYRAFCDALDAAVKAKEFVAPTIKFTHEFPIYNVLSVCERELEAMHNDRETYPLHMAKWFRAVIKMATPFIDKVPERPVKVLTPEEAEARKVETKKAAKVTAEKKKAEKKPAKIENDVDHPLNGAKEAYLYDTRYMRLIHMKSNSKSGFYIQSKTIRNICPKTSTVAGLKGVTTEHTDGTMAADLQGWMKKNVKKGIQHKVRNRVCDDQILLYAAN